jgi:hypothetical protein
MRRLICASIFCLLISSAVAAQQVQMPRRSCRDCKILKQYDRFKDQTLFTLNAMKVADVVDGTLNLGLAAGYKGQTPAGAQKIYMIALIFIAKTPLGASDPELVALVNGKPENFGRLSLSARDQVGYLHTVNYHGYTDRAALSKLGLADKVEMRFGGIEFQLTLDHRIAILDFLADLDGDPVRQ